MLAPLLPSAHRQHNEQLAVPAAAAERNSATRWRQVRVSRCGNPAGGAGRAQTFEHPHDAVRSPAAPLDMLSADMSAVAS
jgi:hypothetical protein